jgi:hypothetical protein
VSFCLPQKVHQFHKKDFIIEPESIHRWLQFTDILFVVSVWEFGRKELWSLKFLLSCTDISMSQLGTLSCHSVMKWDWMVDRRFDKQILIFSLVGSGWILS